MNWQRWIRPGLVATFVVTVVAFFVRSGPVATDLADTVAAHLAAEGQGWAAVEASSRDVFIRGTAPSPEAQQQAVRLAAGLRGVRAVSDRSDLLPLVSPYVWSARRAGQSVTLFGSIPSEGSRGSVLAAMRRALPQAEIVDRMAPARGAPGAFGQATAFALARLAALREGAVTLTDSTLTVSGVAADATAYARARVALRQELPASVVLGPIDLLPARADRFVWSANLVGKTVTVEGFVPNEVVRETLTTTIKATFPGFPVADNVAVASGDPPGFAEAASFAITALERLGQGGVTLDGLGLDVTGVARSVDDYEALLASLAGPLPAGVKVVGAAVTPATVAAYGWRGERTDNRVVFTGYVPSADARAQIAAAARALFPAATVEDRTRIAAGEPRMDWVGGIKFALTQLALLGRGSVDLGNKTYAISGEAANPESYLALAGVNARTLPASMELKQADVTPPRIAPYRFVAERRGTGIVVGGYIPSEDDRQQVLAAARRKFGAVEIRDELAFASGAPRLYVAAAAVGLQALSRMAGGRVEIADRALALAGYAYSAAAVDEIAEAVVGALPEGFTVGQNAVQARQDDQPVAGDRCRDMLQAALQIGRIQFDEAKAELAADSFGILDRIAAVIARCPESGIEVGAHSDSDGTTARNRDRTQARAEAIVDYLVGAGVKRERLTAVGYGEAKPVADNATSQGKAANRRIEFTVELPRGG